MVGDSKIETLIDSIPSGRLLILLIPSTACSIVKYFPWASVMVSFSNSVVSIGCNCLEFPQATTEVVVVAVSPIAPNKVNNFFIVLLWMLIAEIISNQHCFDFYLLLIFNISAIKTLFTNNFYYFSFFKYLFVPYIW